MPAHINQKRSSRMVKTYGIRFKDYRKLFLMQGRACAICGTKAKDTKLQGEGKLELCVDHCHSTGRVRGLLCTPCNTALGFLKDEIARLEKAIEYLKRFECDPEYSPANEIRQNKRMKKIRAKIERQHQQQVAI